MPNLFPKRLTNVGFFPRLFGKGSSAHSPAARTASPATGELTGRAVPSEASAPRNPLLRTFNPDDFPSLRAQHSNAEEIKQAPQRTPGKEEAVRARLDKFELNRQKFEAQLHEKHLAKLPSQSVSNPFQHHLKERQRPDKSYRPIAESEKTAPIKQEIPPVSDRLSNSSLKYAGHAASLHVREALINGGTPSAEDPRAKEVAEEQALQHGKQAINRGRLQSPLPSHARLGLHPTQEGSARLVRPPAANPTSLSLAAEWRAYNPPPRQDSANPTPHVPRHSSVTWRGQRTQPPEVTEQLSGTSQTQPEVGAVLQKLRTQQEPLSQAGPEFSGPQRRRAHFPEKDEELLSTRLLSQDPEEVEAPASPSTPQPSLNRVNGSRHGLDSDMAKVADSSLASSPKNLLGSFKSRLSSLKLTTSKKVPQTDLSPPQNINAATAMETPNSGLLQDAVYEAVGSLLALKEQHPREYARAVKKGKIPINIQNPEVPLDEVHQREVFDMLYLFKTESEETMHMLFKENMEAIEIQREDVLDPIGAPGRKDQRIAAATAEINARLGLSND